MIIVTGGAGFIGSAFVWRCNQAGISDIWVVDDLKTTDNWQNLVALRYREYSHKTDFIDLVLNQKIDPQTITAIVHMGACSATTETDGHFLMENNYRYTRILAEWALAHGIRFIYASSAATFGNGEAGFADDHDVIQHLRPINRYGYSKQFFDWVALENGWLDRLVGLKFFNVFGPNEAHKGDMKSVVCKAYSQILDSGELKLFKSYKPDYADGGQVRDFVYIKDVVEVMWWFLNNTVGGIFNVGTGKARSWNDLAGAVFSAMNKPTRITYIDMPDSLKNQYQYFTEAPMDKLRQVGGPVPQTTLEAAVQDYVHAHLSQGKGLGC
ncbi:MAG: ADP-glyceromanno-heptose 6-epimerase [Candidatus Margulisiibacteriota bacterium]